MYDTGTKIIFMYQLRNDSSDDWTNIMPLIFDKTTFDLQWWVIQQVSWWTSSGSPIWWVSLSFSDNWANNIKVIFWSYSLNDGEVVYNVSTNTWSWYSYAKSSNNKVPLANTTLVNWAFNLSGISYLMTVDYNNISWTNIIDPYLKIN